MLLTEHLYNDILGNYKILDEISSGSYSIVKKAIYLPTSTTVALKFIKKNVSDESAQNEQILNEISNEIQIHSTLSHRNIIKVLAKIDTESECILVLEYAQTDLMAILIDRECAFSENQAKNLLYQICLSLEYIHSQQIAHRDIKLENILVHEFSENPEIDTIIKISDFGLSAPMPDGAFLDESVGSLHYAAPEIVKGEPYNGTEIDAWSCGVVLYTLVCQTFPFSSKNSNKLAKKIIKGKFLVDSICLMSPEL
jgi:serine/threonine protein kinase